MSFELHILGANSALPAFGRKTSCQVLKVFHAKYMIDCGEAAQVSLHKLNIRPSKINQIFISHMHGDHIFGLPGLLSSFSLQKRTNNLTIFGPPGMKKFVDVICETSYIHLTYNLIIHEVDPLAEETIFEDELLTVTTIPLKHRVPCCGYLFREKSKKANIKKEFIEKYDLSVPEIIAIKNGDDFQLKDGTKILNEDLVHETKKMRSYAYCSDTAFNEAMIPQISQVDLLYHEATFMQDLQKQAAFTMHSTTIEAAKIAKMANVGKLVIGHFSSRYFDLNPLLKESRTIFSKSYLAKEGEIFSVDN